MGDKLKPGGLGASMSAGGGSGIPPEYAVSMAQAMEDALNVLLVQEGKPDLPTENTTETRDRRILFVAIARGIVQHLAANQPAFSIRRDDNSVLTNHNVHIEIE